MARRTKKEMAFDELINNSNNLSQREFNKLVNAWLKANKGKTPDKYNQAVLIDLENHLKELGVNKTCPKCNSSVIVANGRREAGTQRLKCCDCGKYFTYFTGTMLEKTKFNWDLWIEVIYQMINDKSLVDIVKVLEDDKHTVSITKATAEKWRYKIFNACMAVPQPVLSGVIEVDETHYHESQKGVKEANMTKLFPGLDRKSRYSYKPAKYGVMGSEFATIITAVDKTNHCVCFVSGLGKFDTERFAELFDPHLQDVQWLCSDFNKVYSKYCDDKFIQHYIRPSEYIDDIKGKTKGELEQLYNDRKLDFVEHQYLTYKQIEKMKEKYGLNLGRVNALHGRIRTMLNHNHNGVSTKHLAGWVAWISLLENYNADYGHKPASRKDAEEILKILLKTRTNIITDEMFNVPLNLPKPSDKELLKLKNNTDQARKKSGRKEFVFTTEDFIDEGSVRKVLNSIPLSKLKAITKHYYDINKIKYKGYTAYMNKGQRYKYVHLLEKESDIKDIILTITAKTGKDIYSGDDNPAIQRRKEYLDSQNSSVNVDEDDGSSSYD